MEGLENGLKVQKTGHYQGLNFGELLYLFGDVDVDMMKLFEA